MSVRVLGPVQVDAVVGRPDAHLGPRDRLVLAALTVRRGYVARPDELAVAVWGDDPPASWPKQVQICVARLRKVLGHSAVETVDGGYRVDGGALDLDVDTFEQLVRRGRRLGAAGDQDRAAGSFARALSLWRGDPFAGLDAWVPAMAESARLHELRSSAEEELLEARLAVGEHREVASQAEVLVAQQPLRERRWAILALAQYRCGRQADALGSLKRAKLLLREDLGIDPGEEITSLETAILRQDSALRSVPPPRPVSDECPYKGLAHHDVGDSLFGRDGDVAACLDRLRDSPLLVVAGPSGSGKSSLVRAGIVPALERSGRHAQVLVPGPGGRLTIPPPGVGSPVLVVDQLEEAFRVVGDADLVADTLARLVAYARGGAPVVVAVRADHLVALTGHLPFSRLAERGLHLVAPLGDEALREAIERPATEAGLRVEPGLVELLVREVQGESGALPLLSHALAETWRRRDGGVLSVEGYRASGGIRGAVARSADRLFDGLDPAERSTLRSVLLRLVGPSVDGDPVRCRVDVRSLTDDPGRAHVMSLLVQARLLTIEDDTVEMSHESLARAWPRLRSWLEEDGSGQQTLRHLTVAAEGWESLGRPDAELYRGGRLETVLEYCDSAHPVLTTVETEFVGASRDSAESERRVLQRRVRDDARRARRLRVLLVSTSALLVVAVAAGALAAVSAREARTQRDVAVAAQSEAALEGLVSTARGLRGSEQDVAALLAIEAVRRWPDDARARSALMSTFTTDPGFLGNRYLTGGRSVVGAVVPGASAGAAVVSVDGGEPGVLDLAGGRIDSRFDPTPGGGTMDRLEVSADGRYVAGLGRGDPDQDCDPARGAVDGCARVVVHEVVSGRLVLGPTTAPFSSGDVALSQDGSLVAVGGRDTGDVVVHRVADGSLLGTLAGAAAPPDDFWPRAAASVAFGTDGRLWVGSADGPLRVVDPVTVEVVRTVDVPAGSTNQHLLVLGDMVVGGGDGALVAVDADGVRWARDLRGTHPDPCPALTASVDAGAVWCGTHYGQIQQHDLATGVPTGAGLDPQLGSVGSLGVGAGGRELVSFGAEAAVVSRWRLDGSGPVASLVAEGHALADGYDPAGGTSLLVADRDAGTTTGDDFTGFALWDPEADRELDPLDAVREARMEGVGWSGRGALVGMRRPQDQVGWFDLGTSEMVDGERIGPECDHLWTSAGGERGYCGMLDGDVWTIDAVTRRRTGPVIESGGEVESVSATAGGALVVVTARTPDGSTTTVHDGSTGDVVAGPMLGPDLTSVSLDGVLVGATGGGISRYDLDTLEPLADLPGARGEVNTLQFSRDGTVLLATSNDQTVSVYDPVSGLRLGDPISSSAPFSYPGYLRPDGRAVAVTNERGVVVWDLDLERQIEAACQVAGRNLTETEWAAYLGAINPIRATCPGLPTNGSSS